MDKKDIKYLVIPDVHCREFWKEPVKDVLENYPESKIVFLGDYLEGYADEWPEGYNYIDKGFENFKEILQLKKDNPDRITLLLGNHDCTHAISTRVCDCRTDKKHHKELIKIYEENRNLFKLCDETEIKNKHFIFSHSGIHKEFGEYCYGDDVNKDNVVSLFNKAYIEEDYYWLADALGIYSRYRGWSGFKWGSIVWADIREWEDINKSYGINIVGHTRIKKPIKLKNIYCLDCSRAFYLNSKGKVKDYLTDEVV